MKNPFTFSKTGSKADKHFKNKLVIYSAFFQDAALRFPDLFSY